MVFLTFFYCFINFEERVLSFLFFFCVCLPICQQCLWKMTLWRLDDGFSFWFILPACSLQWQVSRWLLSWSHVAIPLYRMQMGHQGEGRRLCRVSRHLTPGKAPRWWPSSISDVLLVQRLPVWCTIINWALVAEWAQYKSCLMFPVQDMEDANRLM